MAQIKLSCFKCSTEMTFASLPGRRDECPKCGADVHACRNCAHYDASSYNECREPQADRVQEKERSNFCDHFTPRTDSGPGKNPAQDLRAAAEALFAKKK